MNVKKMPPGKLDALKAMMGGAPSGDSSGDGSGGQQDPGGDVMGPESGAAPEDQPADAASGDAGGDMDSMMSDVCYKLEDAAETLKGVSPDDQQDSSVLDEAKAHLDHAVKLINSLAHTESAEGSDKEPTAEGQGGQMNQKDSEL